MPHLKNVLKGKYYNIYRNNLALPRAYFVSETIYEPDISKSLDVLESDNFDWENQVVVHDRKYHLVPSPGDTKQYSIKKIKISYDNVEIVIENNKTGILVINDLFYPYWKTFDNGEPRNMCRVNGIFRGVRLTPGKHVVKMHFQNPKLTVGIWVTIFSTTICVIGMIVSYRRRDKNKE